MPAGTYVVQLSPFSVSLIVSIGLVTLLLEFSLPNQERERPLKDLCMTCNSVSGIEYIVYEPRCC